MGTAMPRASFSRLRGFEPCRRQNRPSGAILGEKALSAVLERQVPGRAEGGSNKLWALWVALLFGVSPALAQEAGWHYSPFPAEGDRATLGCSYGATP